PGPIVDQHGADALRLFGVLEAGLGSDVRFSDDRLSGAGKFMTKIWNIARFISMFPRPDDIKFKDLTPVDQWILAEANKMVISIIPECNLLDFHKPAKEIRGFTWNLFADHIMELLKGRCFNGEGTFSEKEQKSGWFTLHSTLNIILRALAPVTPFITDRIFRELFDKSGIHRQPYPQPIDEWNSDLTEHTELLQRTNGGFWKFKRETGQSLREGLPEAYVSKELEPWGKDLQAMHGIEKLYFTEPKTDDFVKVTLPESEDVIYIRAPESKE
ncbi:MAG: class I tRNA ligase family protein, partial [Candidatus Thorarchaeota archaeon]